MNLVIRFLGALIVAGGLLAVSMTPAVAADKLNTAYAAVSADQITLFTAEKAGLFKKHDLDVTVVFIRGSTAIVQAMVSGDVQVGHIGGAGLISGRAAGVDLVYLAGLVNKISALVLSTPDIKNPSQLKGKTFGVTRAGTNSDFWARLALTQARLVPEKDVKFTYTGGLEPTYAALENGLIAAGTVSRGHPLTGVLLKKGFNVLIDLHKLETNSPQAGVATTRRYLKENRAVVTRYMKALLEAIKLNHTDKAFAKRVIGDLLRTKDDALLEDNYELYVTGNPVKVPYPTPDGWAELIEFNTKHDPRVKNVTVADSLDDSVMRELQQTGFIKSLGLK
jgi:NitT/TauT family transport system substrate-binding protein